MTDSSTKGSLLVATPLLDDPNFRRTVVLMLEHDDEGALGVVLNRPSEIEVGSALPEWGDRVVRPEVIFVGGPVSQGGVLGLARAAADDVGPGWHPVLPNGIGSLDLDLAPDEIGPFEPARVYSGYAGWGAGQLEAELTEHAWWVVDARDEDLFASDPDTLWTRVLARSDDNLPLFAHFPPDPSMN